MDRRDFLIRSARTVGASLLVPGALRSMSDWAQAAGDGGPPNVLFMMTDQQRRDSLGIYGNNWVKTPNIDRLGRSGVVFDRLFATQPVCSPCRSSILSGCWPHTTGVIDNCPGSGNAPPLPLDMPIFPLQLQAAGYAAGYIGKWHLSEVDTWAKRFDMWEGFQTGGGHWVDKRYKPDIQTEQGIDFVRKHQGRPFCLFMSYYPPHPPRTAPEEYVKYYRDMKHEQPEYYGMVSKIDANVGQFMRCLDDLELIGRTLVIYTTDHGEVFGKYWNKHSKRVCYDGAARLPGIFSWPGRLPRGARSEALASSADLGPTILDICGVPIAEGTQGRSMAPVVRGENRDGREYVVIENNPTKADFGYIERCVVTRDWKLILDAKRPPELYDLKADPEETKNVFDTPEGRAVVPRLAAQMREWATETEDEVAPRLLASLDLEEAASIGLATVGV